MRRYVPLLHENQLDRLRKSSFSLSALFKNRHGNSTNPRVFKPLDYPPSDQTLHSLLVSLFSLYIHSVFVSYYNTTPDCPRVDIGQVHSHAYRATWHIQPQWTNSHDGRISINVTDLGEYHVATPSRIRRDVYYRRTTWILCPNALTKCIAIKKQIVWLEINFTNNKQ